LGKMLRGAARAFVRGGALRPGVKYLKWKNGFPITGVLVTGCSLVPGLSMKTATLNEKYDRGNHTTSLSVMSKMPSENSFLIDTPGIRRMVPDGVKAEELALYMKEFAGFSGRCTFGLSCSHRIEPGCKILEAAAAGLIHQDRYESFLRIGDELAAL